MRVMIVVTHLLGTGHLFRASTLGRAFSSAGHDVSIVSGGMPVAHFDAGAVPVHQLPPVRSDGTDFTRLLTAANTIASPDYLADRQAFLLAALTDFNPDVVITELFPFGRRVLRCEFAALLETAKVMATRPLVLSSIRDILAPPSKPNKIEYAEHMIEDFYDGVLVHSDPDLIPLDRSWPVSEDLSRYINYTGFVAPRPPAVTPDRHADVVVSAGGGDVGDGVFAAACAAAKRDTQRHWRLLIGGAEERRQKIAKNAPENTSIEAPRHDFRELLATAGASVSMCGYNTALDVLQTGVPAILVPFDDGGEVEQSLRADALSTLPGISVVEQSTLDGARLSTAIAEVIAAPTRPRRHAGMDGAARSVQIVQKLRNAAQ